MNVDGNAAAPASQEVTFSFGGYGAEHPGLPPTAGFGIRAAARLIDLAVHWLVVIVAAFTFGIMIAIATAGDTVAFQSAMARLQKTSVIALVLGVAGLAMYHTVCEAWHGSTLGKLILGLVVLNDAGQPCGLRSAFGRSLAFYIDGLFFGIIGYMAMRGSPLDQRKGDEWFHTIVAKRKATPAGALRSPSRFVAGFVLACLVDASFAFLGFLAHLRNWG